MGTKKFRVRSKGSSRHATLPKGGSSASNPKSSRHRDAARAQRLANKYPMVAVDDRDEAALLKNIPMNNISLESKNGKKGQSAAKVMSEKGKDTSDGTATILDQLPLGKMTLLEDAGKEIDGRTAIELFEQLEQTLNMPNVHAWPLIIDKMGTLIGKAGSALCGSTFARVLDTLAQLRDRDDCVFAENIDRLFAVAVQKVGMEALLTAVPLNIDVNAPVLPQDFKRSWLLPILAKNVREDSLDFFIRTLLPLAIRLHQRIPQLPELPRRLYIALERQCWSLLPRCLSTKPRDFHTAMPILAPVIGAALNDRPDLRLCMLDAIRSALHFDVDNGGVPLMERYARNFLPILFSIYTNVDKQKETTTAHSTIDEEAVRMSTLETVRLYVQHLPRPLLSNYITLAAHKLRTEQNDNQSTNKEEIEKKFLLADLLAAFARNAHWEELETIFVCVQHWIDSSNGRAQKKAYRILAEIYRRIEEPELQQFFDGKFPFLESLIGKGIVGLDRSVFPWRVAILRSTIPSFNEFSALSQFANSIAAEIVAFFQRENNRATRHQAALCLNEMTLALVRLGLTADEEISASTALEPLFTKLFGEIKASQSGDEPSFQCSLIALNILTQKQCRLMNATLIAQIIGHTAVAIRVAPPAVRLLAIRILRVLSAKLEQFMFDQYKDLIIEAVFAQNIKCVTSRLRKANALLLERLLDRLGLETLMKSARDRWVWQKQLKNIEKMRRRKKRRSGEHEDELGILRNEKRSKSDTISRVGSVSTISDSAMSSSWMMSGVRTAKADSIFDILHDSSDEEEEESVQKGTWKRKKPATTGERRRKSRVGAMSHLSAVIEEDENEMLDLLDQKSVLNKVSLVEMQKSKAKSAKLMSGKAKRQMKKRGRRDDEEEKEGSERTGGPFRTNKEGKLVITDLDVKSRKRSTNEEDREREEVKEEEENGRKRRKGKTKRVEEPKEEVELIGD